MNVILIGMPACGKSTIGVLLAKSLLLDFIDTDLEIQKKCGKALCEIIIEQGLENFKEIENRVVASLTASNCVIATGGSAVYGKEAMENLKKGGKTVYLKLPCEEIEKRIKNIKTRGIAMREGSTLEELYSERESLYETYADITLDCQGFTAEECVNLIVERLQEK